ncbi:kinase-like domain-containing protein [Spinellus fusiger]|nr:kinase-like domain-containing protein [Spinellus fusiger]
MQDAPEPITTLSSDASPKRRVRPPSVVIESLCATTEETKDGRKINNYLLKKEIGRGAFGTVHLAMAIDTEKVYAVKEFSKSRLRRKERSDMLRRGGPRGRGRIGLGVSRGNERQTPGPLDLVRGEIAILKKLHHPHVVKLFEVLDDPNNDSIYMVFEMAHKGVLMKVQVDQVAPPYSEEEARRYFREMILGIEYLHNNDIVHRDIKPDNLLLSSGGMLKIADFGVSEMFIKGNDMLKKSAGSPAFMAPELCAAHHGEVSGKAADVWSMGITLYCLVYGQTPFTTSHLVDLLEQIQNDSIEYPSPISEDLLDLFQRLLEKDPAQRITMQEMRDHPWVVANEPMISEEENCQAVVTEITEDELNNAIKSIANIFTVMKAVTKFKRHSRSWSQQSLHKIMDQAKAKEADPQGEGAGTHSLAPPSEDTKDSGEEASHNEAVLSLGRATDSMHLSVQEYN